MSELNFSGRQSRVGGLFRGQHRTVQAVGLRRSRLPFGRHDHQRQPEQQLHAAAAPDLGSGCALQSGFTVTGGQMWSLVTETKKSTDNRTENLPMTIDAQYHVGFSWARQPAIRFQQKFGSGFTAAGSLEQAENIYSATNAPNELLHRQCRYRWRSLQPDRELFQQRCS